MLSDKLSFLNRGLHRIPKFCIFNLLLTQCNFKPYAMRPQKINFNYADFDLVKKIALSFPGTEESLSHESTPSVKVGSKLMCRLHESGEFIPIHLDFELRDHYLEKYPDAFHLPEHFKAYPYICMWKEVQDKKLLEEILEASWRGLAGKRLIKSYDGTK